MAWANISIKKAPDDSDGNEQFYLVQFDASIPPPQPGYVKDTKGPLPEAVLRDFLKTFGQSAPQIDEMFRAARAND